MHLRSFPSAGYLARLDCSRNRNRDGWLKPKVNTTSTNPFQWQRRKRREVGGLSIAGHPVKRAFEQSFPQIALVARLAL
jgi:hypothetical protein